MERIVMQRPSGKLVVRNIHGALEEARNGALYYGLWNELRDFWKAQGLTLRIMNQL
jgi:hypothetical protein